jgi:hypothetical protein
MHQCPSIFIEFRFKLAARAKQTRSRSGGAYAGGARAGNLEGGRDLDARGLPSSCLPSWRAAFEAVVISVLALCGLAIFFSAGLPL